MRLIDADKIDFKGVCGSTAIRKQFEKVVEQQPTIVSVEAVRCEDCKHRFAFCCHKHRMYVDRDDFCSWGERRGDK